MKKAFALAFSVFGGAFALWLLWPEAKRTEPAYTRIAEPRVTQAPRVARAQGSPVPSRAIASTESVEERLAANDSKYAELARAACEGEFMQPVVKARNRGSDCVATFLDMDQEIEADLAFKKKSGLEIDMETCIVSDKSGEVSDLDSSWSDLASVTKAAILNGGELPEDDRVKARYERMMGVGLCSFRKSLDYWVANPQEMPNPDEMPSAILFNPYSGRPEPSTVLDAFLDLVKVALTN